VPLTDSRVILLNRALISTTVLLDTLTKQPAKTLAETASLTDALDAVLIFIKMLLETITTADALAKATTTTKTETVAATDTLGRSTARSLAEVLTGLDARLQKAEIEIHFVVDPAGTVSGAEVKRSCGNANIDTLWLRYLRRWQFAPLEGPRPADQQGIIRFRADGSEGIG